jgi:hypothetical protein
MPRKRERERERERERDWLFQNSSFGYTTLPYFIFCLQGIRKGEDKVLGKRSEKRSSIWFYHLEVKMEKITKSSKQQRESSFIRGKTGKCGPK